MKDNFEEQQHRQILARKAFKKDLKEIIPMRTNYQVRDADYDDYTIWFIRKDKDELSDELSFSAQINEAGTALSEVNFCLADITADGPASYTSSQNDLSDLIETLAIVKDFLEK